MDLIHLVNGCKEGDPASVEALYRRYAGRLMGVCLRYVDSVPVAQDLLHDAFLVIVSSIGSLRDPAKLEAWMGAIVRNIALDYLKDDRHFVHPAEAMDLADLPEEPAFSTPPYDELMAMIDTLPPQYGKVFRLSVLDGLSHKEIGALLHIGERTSSSNLFRARQILQEAVRRYWVAVLGMLLLAPLVWRQDVRPPEAPASVTGPVTTVEPGTVTGSLTTVKPGTITGPVATVDPGTDHSPVAIAEPGASRGAGAVSIEAIDEPSAVSGTGSVAAPGTARPDKGAGTERDITLPDLSVDPVDEGLEIPEALLSEIPVDLRIPTQPHRPARPEKVRKRARSILPALAAAVPGTVLGSQPLYTGEGILVGARPSATMDPDAGPVLVNSWSEFAEAVRSMADTYADNAPYYQSLLAIAEQMEDADAPVQERRTYSRPSTLGLSAAIDLPGRWSLRTGLEYTRLTSTGTIGIDAAFVQSRERIHYAGLPLGLSYTLWTKDRLSVDACATGRAEIPFAAIRTTEHHLGTAVTFRKAESFRAPVQGSVSVGIGLQYRVTPFLGLYAEPQLQYHFEAGGAVRTFYTEKPLRLAVPVGVRFTF